MSLTAERWSEIRRVYERALELPHEKRAAYVKDTCGPDHDLAAEVESLLRAQGEAAGFLSQPVVDLQANPETLFNTPDRSGEAVGAYRLEARIGCGGMGEVYRATRADGQFERVVAIKLIRTGADARVVVEHFHRERQILASLDHPNIAQLYDAGATADGIPYLVIEHVDGAPIDRFVETHAQELRAMLRIFLRVCDAVQFAHQRLVVHRDLKPANILVTSSGEVKLLDFGIAKVLDDPSRIELTQTLLMTPAYASPEQIRGEAITTASDVYSLGVLLYKLLTGMSPYSQNTTRSHALGVEICEQEPRSFAAARLARPDAKRWSVSRDLEHITRKALRKKPAERYSSAEQLAEDIRRFLDGAPVLAARGSTFYRLRKFVARHRLGVGVAAIATVLATAGVWEIARQRLIAERRFNDVRQLTNTVIFDVHDSIAELPGATSARKLILDKAIQYLERLERDDDSSLDLQREIAAGYERIALVQGGTASANLGDLAGAEKNHRRSLMLRQRIDARHPGNLADRIALARELRLLAAFEYSARADIQQALALSQSALEITEPLVASHANDRALLTELAEDQLLRVRVLGGVGVGNDARRPRDALQLLQHVDNTLVRLLTLTPGDAAVRRKSAVAAAMTANVAYRLGDRLAAQSSFEKAQGIFAQLANETAQTGDRRNAAFFSFRAGIVLLANDEPAQSRERCAGAVRQARGVLAADPANKDIVDIAINSEACVGHALSHLGQHREAVAILGRAVDAYRDLAKLVNYEAMPMAMAMIEAWHAQALAHSGDLLASRRRWEEILRTYDTVLTADPSNQDAAVNRAMVHSLLGHVCLQIGDAAAATRHHETAISAVTSLRTSQPDYLELDYVEAQSSAGMADASVAARTSTSPAKARDWYRRSLAAWSRVPAPGRLSVAGFAVVAPPESVARKLALIEK